MSGYDFTGRAGWDGASSGGGGAGPHRIHTIRNIRELPTEIGVSGHCERAHRRRCSRPRSGAAEPHRTLRDHVNTGCRVGRRLTDHPQDLAAAFCCSRTSFRICEGLVTSSPAGDARRGSSRHHRGHVIREPPAGRMDCWPSGRESRPGEALVKEVPARLGLVLPVADPGRADVGVSPVMKSARSEARKITGPRHFLRPAQPLQGHFRPAARSSRAFSRLEHPLRLGRPRGDRH